MVFQNMLRTQKGNNYFRRKKSDLWTLLIYSNAFNRSNNKDCSLRAHLFLSYNPICLPWYKASKYFESGIVLVGSLIGDVRIK